MKLLLSWHKKPPAPSEPLKVLPMYGGRGKIPLKLGEGVNLEVDVVKDLVVLRIDEGGMAPRRVAMTPNQAVMVSKSLRLYSRRARRVEGGAV